MAAITTTSRTRQQAMPERWQRAMPTGVQVRQLQGNGQWIVTSASDPCAAYETDGLLCTCPGALLGYDPIGLHRAAYCHAKGKLGFDVGPRHRLQATWWRSLRHSGANRTISPARCATSLRGRTTRTWPSDFG